MITSDSEFDDQARAIAEANNLSFEEAANYLSLIGDTPEMAEDGGRVIVRDEQGNELARIHSGRC